ncbi:MAG TPA: phospholipase D-like domain-containing protein [Patescibacteria group bacterium]|nr:phospholipase D-like domain-containing protein [Patescibacteria group bacterium]
MLGRLFHRTEQAELATSLLFNERTFYAQFRQDLERAKKEIVIESPFMTSRRVRSLLPDLRRAVQRGVEITVSTREPEEHEGFLRLEARRSVAALQTTGIQVLLTVGHHRKLAIIDRKILWEGSHNILSQNNSREVMRRIDSTIAAEQMVDFIQLSEFL